MKISPVNFANFTQRKVNFQSSFITAHGNNEQKNEQGIPQSICDIRDTACFDMTVTPICNGAHCRLEVDDTNDGVLQQALKQRDIYFEEGNGSSMSHGRVVLPPFMREN